MSSTLGNDYVGAVGPNGIAVWRPTPFPAGAIQGMRPGAPSGGGGGGGSGGGTDASGNVYAAALFYAATCQASDQIGAFVRAATGDKAVVTVTCYQPYPAIGIIVSKATDTTCVVQTYGLSAAATGLVANSRYLVGPTGRPVQGPALPAAAPYVQTIGFAVQANALFVMPSGTIYRRDTSAAPAGDGGDTVVAYPGGLLHGENAPDDSVGRQDDYYPQSPPDGSGPVLWGPRGPQHWDASGINLRGRDGTPGSQFFWSDAPPTGHELARTNDAFFFVDATNNDVLLHRAL